MNVVQELAERLGKGADDFLFIEPYSIGDAVRAFGLLPAFRRTYCREDQRIIVLRQDRAMPVSTAMPFADACFFRAAGLRYDDAPFGLPTGERILVNDDKPGGLVTALAVPVRRDAGLGGLTITVRADL